MTVFVALNEESLLNAVALFALTFGKANYNGKKRYLLGMLFHNLRYVRRIREILTVFVEEGFGYVIKRAQLHQYVPFVHRWKDALRAQEDSWKPEVSLRRALTRLGPTFVKLGQVLSLRPDVLPAHYVHELEKMQDKVPAIAFSEIRKVIQQELGGELSKLFVQIDTKPVASASLAQVYKARLKTGETVAVKVLRPGIEKLVKEDTEILLFLAQWVDRRKALPLQLTPIIEEFRRWTLREINLHYEAVALRLFRENFHGSKAVMIPKVYDPYSSERVLTLQFIAGIPLHDVKRLGSRDKVRAAFRKTYEALGEMVFEYGLFHGDPHPGNILVAGDKIAFIDFGIVGKLDEKLRRASLLLFGAVIEGDADEASDALLSLRRGKSPVDEDQLRRDIEDIIDQSRFEELGHINFGLLLRQVLDVIQRHDIHPQLDFVLVMKAFITIEGLALRYNPSARVSADIVPIVKRIAAKESSPRAVAQRLRARAQHYGKLVEKAPEYMIDTLQRLSEGRVDVEIVPREFLDLRIELEHGTGNIAIGMMVAALMVSSAIIMQVITEPRVFGFPAFSLIGFVLAGILGLWLVRRTIFIQGGAPYGHG